MAFGGINYLAVLVAALVGMAIGAAWYTGLSKPWIKASRFDKQHAKPMPMLLATSFVCLLVMAWTLAGIIGHLGVGEVTVRNGLISGFFVWLGFMATVLVTTQRYEGFGWDLTLIDATHWLVVAVAMGAVIGWMGV